MNKRLLFGHTKIIDKATRSIEGMANTVRVDRDGDIVLPGAANDSLAGYLTNPVILAVHQYWAPAGKPTVIGKTTDIKSTASGIWFKMNFASKDANPLAENYWLLYEGGYMNTFSIGFMPMKWIYASEADDAMVQQLAALGVKDMKGINRLFSKIELLEISCVPVPSERGAVVIRGFGEPGSNLSELEMDVSKTMLDILGRGFGEHGTLATIDEGTQCAAGKTPRDFKTYTEDELAVFEAKAAMKIQTLIFSKEKFTREQAVKWATDHQFHHDKVDDTADSFRLRQFDPGSCKADTLRTIDITDGVKAVACKTEGASKMVHEHVAALRLAVGIIESVAAVLEQQYPDQQGEHAGSSVMSLSFLSDNDLSKIAGTMAEVLKNFDLPAKQIPADPVQHEPPAARDETLTWRQLAKIAEGLPVPASSINAIDPDGKTAG